MSNNEIKHNRKLLNASTTLWCFKATTGNLADLGLRDYYAGDKRLLQKKLVYDSQ